MHDYILKFEISSGKNNQHEGYTVETTLKIDALTYGEAGIGRTEEGKAVFVPQTAPGDLVRVRIDQDKRSFSTGTVLEVLEASPDRVMPACPYSTVCGGCSWMHVDYRAQLVAKRANVVAQLVHIAGFDEETAESLVSPCTASGKQLGYRNKLELSAGLDENGRWQLGFRSEGSHEFATPDYCLLAHKAIQKAPKALRGALRYLQRGTDLGIYRVGVRHSERTRDVEIALWTPPSPFPRSMAANTLQSALKASSIVRVIADPGKARKVKNVETLYGKGYWRERLGGSSFHLTAPSFFQVNTEQAEVMVDKVIEGLRLDEHSLVADLYAGAGTFSVALAKRVDDVFAVESAASSVRDLRRNAESNNVWIDVIGGDAARELPELGGLDALVVDPPRAGLADGVAQSIAAAGPTRVAYVSCNPSTWARDVVRLEACGYRLVKADPVDLFPQTYHCEIVSIFERL